MLLINYILQSFVCKLSETSLNNLLVELLKCANEKEHVISWYTVDFTLYVYNMLLALANVKRINDYH